MLCLDAVLKLQRSGEIFTVLIRMWVDLISRNDESSEKDRVLSKTQFPGNRDSRFRCVDKNRVNVYSAYVFL